MRIAPEALPCGEKEKSVFTFDILLLTRQYYGLPYIIVRRRYIATVAAARSMLC